MAGLLAGDTSQHRMVENGSCSLPQDKPEEASRWYLSRKEIEENSPSRRDGIDLKKEAYLRKSYCTFLQDLGMRLKVPQVTIATAIIFCHRFFLRQSHTKNDRRTIATVCMFLAGKVEETPKPLKDVILASYEIINKKDPAAVQRMKQKEIYEQQKEMILIGERVVLATLGFDFNVHHPYKPLVEAIKKFKVAQNALAQVAWNFVNDGLRTSLCLQFKPHHIAAGAILLAAKFLKVKLPSDGEKIWWQEFGVTPRQLEEVSNQMLELYEQNRLPQGTEVKGSAGGGSSHKPMPKATPSANEESGKANGFTQGGGTASVKPGAAVPHSTPLVPEQTHADTEEDAQRDIRNQIGDSADKESVISNHKVDCETKEHQSPEQEPLPYVRKNEGETSNRSMSELDHLGDECQKRNNGKNETIETGAAPCKPDTTAGQNLEYREAPVGQSPHDAIRKFDKDKLKAILEKRRKSRDDVPRKIELMDEDDLIERELEDGIELAAENEKIKQERRQSWTKHLNSQELEKPESEIYNEDYEDRRNPSETERQSSLGPEVENVEDGEVANEGLQTPKASNGKRKADSPDKNQNEGKRRNGYPSGYHHNHPDISDDGNRIDRLGYAERDLKLLAQENHV